MRELPLNYRRHPIYQRPGAAQANPTHEAPDQVHRYNPRLLNGWLDVVKKEPEKNHPQNYAP